MVAHKKAQTSNHRKRGTAGAPMVAHRTAHTSERRHQHLSAKKATSPAAHGLRKLETAGKVRAGLSDHRIAERILRVFLDPKIAGSEHALTTGDVMRYLAVDVSGKNADLFKAILKSICAFSKPSTSIQPGVWTLLPKLRPEAASEESPIISRAGG